MLPLRNQHPAVAARGQPRQTGPASVGSQARGLKTKGICRLSGCGDLLLEKKTNNPDTSIFLQELPHLLVLSLPSQTYGFCFQKTIDSIHKSIKGVCFAIL